MATLTIRQLDDELYARLKREAKANHRSVEAEARFRLENGGKPVTTESLAERFAAVRTRPATGYGGSVALIRAIRDEE